MTEVLLIRHGQSANNALPSNQRIPDPGLTALGTEQARRTAQYLVDVSVTHLYCSPFTRSLETMRPIAQALQMSVSVRADLFEQGGCYSGFEPGCERGEPGLSRSQIAARYPGWQIDTAIGEDGWWGRNYESKEEATCRAESVARWMQYTIVHQGGVHVLVIHADFKRLLIAAMLGARADHLIEGLGPLRNVGISRFVWDAGIWRPDGLNITTHLPSDCIS